MKHLILLFIFLTGTQFISPQSTTNWWNDRVFYEIFVRSFYDANGNGIGDIKGLTQKLNYLNDGNDATTDDLGITAIWLMPVMQSPSYHGYDVIDYKQIEQDYGNNQDFNDFLDSAHARGIRVIIDLVLNHASSQNPWFVSARTGTSSPYRNWFRWSPNNPGTIGPWGQTVWHNTNGNYYYGIFTGSMPDLNYNEPAVKTEIGNIAKYWLDTVGVDGFRLDAVKYIYESGTVLEDVPATFEFWRQFRSFTKGVNPEALSVGEAWSSTTKVLPYSDGTGLDFCFEFETATDIINAINSGSPTTLMNHMKNVITKNYPFLQYGTFLTNHDQTRIYSQLSSNLNKSKLAATVLLTFPGVPFLYYGEEIGMTSGSDDPSKRTPMQWTNGNNAGFTTGTPWKAVQSTYTTHNVQTMSADSNSLLNHYKKLIRIRNNNKSLRTGKYFHLNSTDSKVYVFARHDNAENTIIIPVLNFSNSGVSNPGFTNTNNFTGLPPGTYNLTDQLTNSTAGQLVINSNGDINCTLSIVLAPQSGLVLKAELAATSVDENFAPLTLHLEQNYPNPFNPSTNIEFEIPSDSHVKLSIYNLLGEKVSEVLNKWMAKGMHALKFDAADLNSGVYIYKLETNGYSVTKKMSVIK